MGVFPECGLLWSDAAAVNAARALDIKQCGLPERLESVEVYVAGFSCKSLSHLNKAKANKGCVQAQESDTGNTFAFTMLYISTRRPRLVILDNVTGLDQADDKAGMSDAAYIVEEIKALIYHVELRTIDAPQYGAICTRRRLYFVAVEKHKQDDAFPEITSVLTGVAQTAFPAPWTVLAATC